MTARHSSVIRQVGRDCCGEHNKFSVILDECETKSHADELGSYKEREPGSVSSWAAFCGLVDELRVEEAEEKRDWVTGFPSLVLRSSNESREDRMPRPAFCGLMIMFGLMNTAAALATDA